MHHNSMYIVLKKMKFDTLRHSIFFTLLLMDMDIYYRLDLKETSSHLLEFLLFLAMIYCSKYTHNVQSD